MHPLRQIKHMLASNHHCPRFKMMAYGDAKYPYRFCRNCLNDKFDQGRAAQELEVNPIPHMLGFDADVIQQIGNDECPLFFMEVGDEQAHPKI
ncbi:hypothetical protein PoMZ_07215 [Pyricularia oryzae]|uniref:Uncharacterized protein n=1 Tax=Pyricularia oryzae TaxID=318829 RepID=A0A4P7NEJ9_PYROR|nr:hypothetical protein PoMZ_07215 [Pyricularia oryzae]